MYAGMIRDLRNRLLIRLIKQLLFPSLCFLPRVS